MWKGSIQFNNFREVGAFSTPGTYSLGAASFCFVNDVLDVGSPMNYAIGPLSQVSGYLFVWSIHIASMAPGSRVGVYCYDFL